MLKIKSETGTLNIYTDGGCHNESGDLKGIGAWAFVVQDENSDKVEVCAQRVTDTTNNRTEMMAIINAISFCEVGSAVHIISDSGYVVKGYTDPAYLDKWVANGWKTSNNKDVSNIDLWNKILILSYHHRLSFTHIRGHMKDKNIVHAYWNNIVDMACTAVMHDPKFRDYEGIVKLIFDKQTKSFSTKLEVV
jgi:ribonuclease HI